LRLEIGKNNIWNNLMIFYFPILRLEIKQNHFAGFLFWNNLMIFIFLFQGWKSEKIISQISIC